MTAEGRLRLVSGDAHMSACHYAEELEAVSVGELKASVSASDLVVKKASADSTRETYIKFDFSSVSAVTSAKLRLNARLSALHEELAAICTH